LLNKACTRPGQTMDNDPTNVSPLSKLKRSPMLLGLFLPIQRGGWSASNYPRTTDWTFEYNAKLTRKAEELGFDLVFGLAQWLGKNGLGGDNYQGISLDSFMAGCALAPITNRIVIISTVHVLYGPWHPLMLAKFAATLDHISGGRWGMNIVTGHLQSEYKRFGAARIEHDHRYAMADEFVTIMNRLWTEDENITYSGPWWSMEEGFVGLKPKYGRPIITAASASPAGIKFAARHADILFTTSPAGANVDDAISAFPDLVHAIRRAAQENGRELRSLVNPMIICRETEREAIRYRDAIVAHADHGAIEGYARKGKFDSDAHAWRNHKAVERSVGWNIQIVGSPEQVADYIIRLNRTGLDGMQVSFFDFEPDLQFFGERVLPLLYQAGLRI